MTAPKPTRQRWPQGGNSVAALALGLLVIAALTIVDVWVLPASAIIALVVLAPLGAALLGPPRTVAIVGVVAVALVVASVIWHDNADLLIYVYRILVVAAISALAVLGARARQHVARDRERFAVLAAVAEIADGTQTLDDTIAGLNALVVPTLADICIVDALSEGRVQRLGVGAAEGVAERAKTAIAPRPPDAIDRLGDPDEPHLLATVDDAVLRRIAHDDADLKRLRSLGATSALIVPLRARGRRLGALTLIVTRRSGRSYDEEDLEFAVVLAGRAALALDNAGLFSELETIEAQLTAALSTLAEAVTVQHPGGSLIYANEAAARMLGFASAQELLATPAAEIAVRFESAHEDGRPLRIEDVPGRRIIAGERDPEPLIVRAVDRRTGRVEWRVAKASGVYGADGELKLVVNVIEDITDVKRAELTQGMLARAGELLASSLDYERTLQQVAELAVPEIADWCVVSLPDGNGFIRGVAVAHVDPEKVSLARSIGERFPTPVDAEHGTARVMRDGESQLTEEITDDLLVAVARDDEHLELLRGIGLRSALVVPMKTGGKAIGVLSLVQAESGRRFDEGDVKLSEELARRAASAVEHSRLYTERSRIACTLQTSLLPGRMPEIEGWAAATLYRPAGDQNWVGGDFYDAFEVRGGWMAIVGDVAGRGAAAAALTGLARYTLRTAATLLEDPLDAVGILNGELLGQESMSLCSIAAVVMSDARDGSGNASARIVCAGHPLPLRVREGIVQPVGSFSPMLGGYAVDEWQRTIVDLAPGDVLVVFTDGVFDAVGEEHERFGEERLERTLAGTTDAADAVARIDAALTAFATGEQADDTAILALQRLPVAAVAPRPRQP